MFFFAHFMAESNLLDRNIGVEANLQNIYHFLR